MKAITTRYHGATAHRPARIIASDQDGNRATVPADGDFPYDDAHHAAAVALCHKMGWPGAETLAGGTIKGSRVWVFTHDPAAPPQPTTAELDALFDDRSDCVSCGHRTYRHRRQPSGTYYCEVAGCDCAYETPLPEALPRCGDPSPPEGTRERTGPYRCTLAAGHDGEHCMTTHPMEPTWPR